MELSHILGHGVVALRCHSISLQKDSKVRLRQIYITVHSVLCCMKYMALTIACVDSQALYAPGKSERCFIAEGP